jgi:GxxExxY protein
MHAQNSLITGQVLDAAIKVHNELGPGLFESVYEGVLLFELTRRGFNVTRQQAIPVVYAGIKFEDGFRADLIVESRVIVEIKSIEQLAPVHFKQMKTYLKLANLKDGVLINFNVDLIKEGFHRVFNNHIRR